jgi:Zn-dependent peptidase ImmA (M78 family)
MAPNEVPLGLAVRHNGSDNLRLIFRKMNRMARRFEAARFLADHLLAPAKDHWLPVTDSKTARQKAQRAFAVEFLCPIEELKAFLDGDFSSDDAIDGAGEYFGVSALAIRSHLANNGLTPRF